MTLTVRQRVEEQPSRARRPRQSSWPSCASPWKPTVRCSSSSTASAASASPRCSRRSSSTPASEGAIVLGLDGGAIEPTQRGFLAALSNATGGTLETPDEAGIRLAGLGSRVVLALDRYEVLRPLDLWLQQAFVPALPDNVRVVVAGREAPMAGWSIGMGGLFRSLPLGNLTRDDAEALLRRDGVTGDDIERIDRLARGHPLSLRMAAAAIVGPPARDHDTVTVTAIVDELTELYLAGLDPATREALDAASVVRRPTVSLLAAMLPDAAPQDAFDRLRALPFVELTSDGLVLHDTVREGVAAYLRASDPDRLRRYRIAAWRQLRDEVGRASPAEMWRYTADLLFILQNPMIREAFFPTTEHLYFVERRPPSGLAGDCGARASAAGPAASVSILDEWWQRDPDAVPGRARRRWRRRGLLRRRRAGPGKARVDSTSTRWRAAGATTSASCRCRAGSACCSTGSSSWATPRSWSSRRSCSTSSACTSSCGPRCGGSTRSVSRRWRGPRGSGSASSHSPVEPVRIDGVAYHLSLLDFGPASVDGWLTRIIATELRIEEDTMLDVAQRQLVLGGRRIDLTKLEFEVFRYLSERPGQVVERADAAARRLGLRLRGRQQRHRGPDQVAPPQAR